MTENWISIFSTDRLHQAELIKNTLQQFGIETVILNQRDSLYHVGEISIMIPIADQEKAIEILKSIHGGE